MTYKFARNSVFNFLGAVMPALANLLAVPVMVNKLGAGDYGLLTLVIALIGYFALLDINATQGSIRFIAEYDSLGQPKQADKVISISLLIYVMIGFAGMVLIYGTSPFLIKSVFEIPAKSTSIALATLKIAAVAFLFSQLQAYLISIPQAMQRYCVSAAVQSFFGSVAPLVSMAVAMLNGSVQDIVLARLCLSVLNVAVLSIIILRLRPNFKFNKPDKGIIRRLLSFSVYSYLSTIAAVSYAHADRMILGILLGLAEITFYSVPTALVNRLFSLTYRLSSVIYPATSELSAQGNKQGVRHVYLLASRYMTAINVFLVLIVIVYGQEILHLWIGPKFVQNGYPVMVFITIGIYADSATNLPSLINNAIAHPRTTGLFAVARALLGILALIVGTRIGGIIGTALGHLTASCLCTAAFLLYVHNRSVPVSLLDLIRRAYLPTVPVAVIVGTISWFSKPVFQVPLHDLFAHGFLTSVIYCLALLLFVVTPEDRRALFNKLSLSKQPPQT